jgi:hypothetical protein
LRWKAIDKNLIWEETIPPKCLWTKINRWFSTCTNNVVIPKGKRVPFFTIIVTF